MSMCWSDRHVWNWSAGTTTDVLLSPALRCACGALAHGDIDPLKQLEAEVARLTEQVRIATETLNEIARCGCSACGPAPRDLVHARTLADDALTCMSVVE